MSLKLAIFQKLIRDEDDFFFFKFDSITGLEQVLEQGPWMIRNTPIILNKWGPNLSLCKDKVTSVPIWVKLHKVPVVAYSEDGLSLIASQIGKPVMLDAFTTSMCNDPWGRIGFARALIEVSATTDLKKEVIMAVPHEDGTGHTKVLITVEYEWKPPLSTVEDKSDGYTIVTNKRRKRKDASKPLPNLVPPTVVNTSNAFSALNDDLVRHVEEGEPSGLNSEEGILSTQDEHNEESDSEVEETIVAKTPIHKGANTPSNEVFKAWDWTSNVNLCNTTSERRLLWTELGLHKHLVHGYPWILMGDFNMALNLEDSLSGSSRLNAAMYDFKACVNNIKVMDINASGLHYTWNQKPKGGGGLLKKLDQIMRNLDFVDTFPGAYGIFQPYRISDHSPAVLKIPSLIALKPKPFKFFNFITFKSEFLVVVERQWSTNVEGHNMYQVVTKLKILKKPLRKLLHSHGNLHERVNSLRIKLDEVQKALDKNPNNSNLRDEEAVYVQAFTEAKLDEERFLKQKAKIEWLEVGDSNSAYFRKSVKSRNYSSRIEVIRGPDNIEVTGSLVVDTFVSHYQQFLGTSRACEEPNTEDLFTKVISDETRYHMVRTITNEEIKSAMFNIGDDRAPRPDGFTSAFLKKSWDVVGSDICNAVTDFFSNGKLLKEINHTFLVLIPKLSTPLKVTDYKPISCCNVLYKCISKIISNRIIEGLKEVVSDNQSAFIPDDLFIFSRGEIGSTRLIMESLDEFQKSSGLVPNISKSMAYFCNVSNPIKLAILDIIPFAEGELPVKYLGVPLISTRLCNRDCKILVEKVTNKIGDWKNKSLSFAGRLQLCRSVFSSMHVYWASVLVIPKGIILDIQQHMRGFLWCNGELRRGKAKVAWDIICLPKREGGLKTSFWYDRWCSQSPIIQYLSPRDITNEGYNLQNRVADLVTHGGWSWPQTWLRKAPNLGQLPVPILDEARLDTPQWREVNGKFSNFLVKYAWDALRPRRTEVPWYQIVLFSQCILRHAFHLWLVMRNSLKTQDRLRQWDVGVNSDVNLLCCTFCDSQPDSHGHLFFEYSFSTQVWRFIRPLAGMEDVSQSFHDIISYLQPMAHRRTAKSIIGRILVVAAAYFIWVERNNRLFKKVRRSPKEICDIIMVTVRLKLLTFQFKNKAMLGALVCGMSHSSSGISSLELEVNVVFSHIPLYLNDLLVDSDEELKDDSEDDVFEAEEEIDVDIQEHETKETYTHQSTEEPHSQEHQSPPHPKEQPKSSKAKETNALHFGSLCFETFRPYDNYMSITKRQLVRNHQHISEVLYAQVANDHWEKHKETAAFYDDLRANVEGYYEENVDHMDQTDKLVEKTMTRLDKISQAGVDDKAKLLKTLNRVFETLEADSALKEAMQKMVESNNTTFGNITSLIELLRNAQLPEIFNQLNTFQSTLNTLSSQCASISESLKKEPEFSQRLLRAAEVLIPQPTGPVIDITPPEKPESPPVAPKADRGKGKVMDDVESPPKLVKASLKVRPDVDTPIRVDYILVMMSEEPNTNARETYAPPHKVLTNHDLLTEIFIRLPILSIHLFTCVSKQWLKILKSPAFTLKRSQIRSLDSPAGLFVNHIRSSFDCDFVSLDPRINSRKYTIKNSFTLGSTEEADKVTILQSCNGLLLCTGSRRHAFDYVYNPSTNLLKILPEPDYANVDSNVYGCAGLRLAFDPRKSPYYKVVRAGRTCSDIFIQIYCSEKGNWSLCNERFNYFFFLHFDSAMYWNNALHWLETENS
ncbi:hypothetical protein Tco_1303942 [Tanacetum coccineum]